MPLSATVRRSIPFSSASAIATLLAPPWRTALATASRSTWRNSCASQPGMTIPLALSSMLDGNAPVFGQIAQQRAQGRARRCRRAARFRRGASGRSSRAPGSVRRARPTLIAWISLSGSPPSLIQWRSPSRRSETPASDWAMVSCRSRATSVAHADDRAFADQRQRRLAVEPDADLARDQRAHLDMVGADAGDAGEKDLAPAGHRRERQRQALGRPRNARERIAHLAFSAAACASRRLRRMRRLGLSNSCAAARRARRATALREKSGPVAQSRPDGANLDVRLLVVGPGDRASPAHRSAPSRSAARRAAAAAGRRRCPAARRSVRPTARGAAGRTRRAPAQAPSCR